MLYPLKGMNISSILIFCQKKENVISAKYIFNLCVQVWSLNKAGGALNFLENSKNTKMTL